MVDVVEVGDVVEIGAVAKASVVIEVGGSCSRTLVSLLPTK